MTSTPNYDPDAMSRYADAAFSRMEHSGFAELSATDQTFICVWALDGEVNNGGFDQWFFNSSGDYATSTPDALRRIGADRLAEIVDRAISAFDEGGPMPDIDDRRQQMLNLGDHLTRQLSDRDQEFYSEPDGLDVLLYNYIHKNGG